MLVPSTILTFSVQVVGPATPGSSHRQTSSPPPISAAFAIAAAMVVTGFAELPGFVALP